MSGRIKPFVLPFAICLGILTFTSLSMRGPIHPDSANIAAHFDSIDEATAKNLSTPLRRLNIEPVEQVAPTFKELPEKWCGKQPFADLKDLEQDQELPKFKLYYVFAPDQPNRFYEYADKLQQAVSHIHSFIARQSGYKKVMRFDTGTECGPEYVDIQTIVLPNNLSSYRDDPSDPHRANMYKWSPDMNKRYPALFAGQKPYRNPIFYMDQVLPEGLLAGFATLPGFPINEVDGQGDSSAWITGPSGPVINGWLGSNLAMVMLHEMTHALGAVSPDAPHATETHHCTELTDLMCYEESGLNYRQMTLRCAPLDSSWTGLTKEYDCGKDDYFNPEPTPGMYLSSGLNVFNSAYMTECLEFWRRCEDTGRVVRSGGTRTVQLRKRMKSHCTADTVKVRKMRRSRVRLKLQAKPSPGRHTFDFRLSSSKLTLGKGQWQIKTCTKVLNSAKRIDNAYPEKCRSVSWIIKSSKRSIVPPVLYGTARTENGYLSGYIRANQTYGNAKYKCFVSNRAATVVPIH